MITWKNAFSVDKINRLYGYKYDFLVDYDSIDVYDNRPCQIRPALANKINNMNVNVFSLMSRVNKTRFLGQHKSCECKCRLNENICN